MNFRKTTITIVETLTYFLYIIMDLQLNYKTNRYLKKENIYIIIIL